MNKFKKVTEPEEMDFFSVFADEKGVKHIRIHGYIYKSSSKEYVTPENPLGTYWAKMDCDGFVEPLSEFAGHNNADYVNDGYEGCPQYQTDYSSEGIVDVINTYFNGKPADARLYFPEVNEDTPCGNYVR